MGGDRGPSEVISGVVAASKELKNAFFILVGDEKEITGPALFGGLDVSRFSVVGTSDVVLMEDDPLTVIRHKPDSSMVKGLNMLASGEGDTIVSTGNTGALFTGATLIVRKIKGVLRPAIAGVLPLENPVLLLDSGANVTASAEYLAQFAVMGSIYMQKVLGVQSPRVGLLNNGSEPHKGTELQTEAYRLISSLPGICFSGNVEADRLCSDVCDVLVTDGFTGNILLKSYEGMGKFAIKSLRDIYEKDLLTKASALLIKKRLAGLKKRMDPGEYGGAPFLGLSKPVIKAHGASDANAVKNAIKQAVSYTLSGAVVSMAKEIRKFAPEQSVQKESGQPQNGGTVAK